MCLGPIVEKITAMRYFCPGTNGPIAAPITDDDSASNINGPSRFRFAERPKSPITRVDIFPGIYFAGRLIK